MRISSSELVGESGLVHEEFQNYLKVMNFLVIISLVILNSSAKGESFLDYLGTGDDFEQQYPLDDRRESNYTNNNDSRSNSQEGTFHFTTVDVPFPFINDGSENQPKRKFDGPLTHYFHHSRNPPLGDITSKRLILDNLSKQQGSSFTDEKSGRNDVPELKPPPIRSEINNWERPDDFFEGYNFPWNYDSYYHNPIYPQSEFLDYWNPPLDSYDEKNETVIELPQTIIKTDSHSEPPQYYQKNYYYNYYPLPLNSHKNHQHRMWMGRDGNLEGNNKNRPPFNNRRNKDYLIKKSSCKQYLEFLKYAFEKLDESSEYNYDYTDDYNEYWGERAEHPMFNSHVMGPTLYVDNSGKISHINYRGNSHPTVKEFVSFSTSSMADKNLEKKRFESTTPYTIPTVESPTPTTVYFNQPRTTKNPPLEFSTQTPFPQQTTENITAVYNKTSKKWQSVLEYKFETIHESTPQKVETTVRVDTEAKRRNLGNDFYDDVRTTSTNVWDPSEDFHNKLEDKIKRTTEKSSNNSEIFTNTTYSFESSRSFLTTTPTIDNPSTEASHKRLNRNEEGDCNDKMLPCPDTVNVTYPLNGYCNRYVSCESGRAIRRICPRGLHFNLITKGCDLPHSSFCTYVCPEPDGYYGVPGDCGGYFVCENSNLEYRMCPPGMHWDNKRKRCTFAELSSCPMKCSQENEVKPYDGDCKAYVICLGGNPYYHKCPPNAIFDGKAMTCVPKTLFHCEDDPGLLTSTINPNHLCKDIQGKMGLEIWCNYFDSIEKNKSNEWMNTK